MNYINSNYVEERAPPFGCPAPVFLVALVSPPLTPGD
jgi:hypothetical protein